MMGGKAGEMRIKELREWLGENNPMVEVERENKHTIFTFDKQTQTPVRFETVLEAAYYFGAVERPESRDAQERVY